MEPFVDSTRYVNDGLELRTRMNRDGYLYIRNLLPQQIIEELRLKWLGILGEAGWLKKGTASESGIPNLDAFCVEPEIPYMEVMTKVFSLIEYHSIPHHSNVVGFFERMLGGTIMNHPRLIGRTIFPQRTDYTTPPHQDWIPIQGTPETYTAWIPLSDITKAMGGLQLCTGSHQSGIYDFQPALGAGAMEVVDPLEGKWVNNPMQQGDIIFFHSMMVHKGVSNNARQLRLSMDARFQRTDQPICPNSLEPHGKEVRDWKAIYKDWPQNNQLKYYWKQYDLRFQPYDLSYNEKRDQLGFAMAAAGDPRALSVLQRIIARGDDTAKRVKAEKLLAKLKN